MEEKEIQQYEKMVLTPADKLIAKLAVPTIISMMISMIYNLVDAFFVGKLGTSASAAIGILMGIQTVFQAVGFMCGHGSGSIISRKLGEGKIKDASKYVSSALFICLLISCCIMLVEIFTKTPLLLFLGSTDTILPYALNYGIFIMLSGPALSCSCVLNNVMRYEGRAFYAMIGLVSGGVLNMALDPVFMFGLNMGISGAGLATALSQYISFFILLYMFLSGKTMSKISLSNISTCPSIYGHIFKNGFPSLIRQSLNTVSSMTLNIAAKPYGDPAIAAMAIVGRLAMFFGSFMIGMGQGYQPVAAFNYGAGKYERIRNGFAFTLKTAECILSIVAILGFLFPAPLISLFRDDPAVIVIGKNALRFQCVALVVQPVGVMSNMTFQSIGKSRIASFLATLRSGLYYIPILLILPKIIGITGIESAQMLSDILTFLTAGPIIYNFFSNLPHKDEERDIDREYKKAVRKKP